MLRPLREKRHYKDHSRKRREARSMTVCVAAMAAERQAIVLIADKMITLGDIVSDTSICKMSRLANTSWIVMVAGTISIADEIIMRVAYELEKNPRDADQEYSMMKVVSRVYTEVYQEHLEATVLTPKLLTKKLAFERESTLHPLHQKLADEIDEDRKQFRWSCELLVCGFDSKRDPTIFQVFQPGHASSESRQGYAAIGIGADAATGRLMWHESDCEHPLDRVLWETFDAKVQAEIMRGVGYNWDGFIMLQSDPMKAVPVPDDLQEIMDNAISEIISSPFDPEPTSPDRVPPPDWKEQITRFADSLIPSELTFC